MCWDQADHLMSLRCLLMMVTVVVVMDLDLDLGAH